MSSNPLSSSAVAPLSFTSFVAAAGLLMLSIPHPTPKAVPADVATGTRYAVASESEEASRAALRVLEEGGDAVDAAVAAAFVLGMTTPSASGIGGGGFALVYRAKEQRAYALDFRETAPQRIDAEVLEKRPLPPKMRGAYVGVPGEVAGLGQIHSRWGKKPWRDLLRPAITLGREGFLISPHLAKLAGFLDRPLRELASPLAAELLAASGAKPAGTKTTRLALSRTLQIIADEGPRAFYLGPMAQQMVRAAQESGGTLSLEDLGRYVVKERVPLRATFGSFDVMTMPPPSAGGVMLLETLAMDTYLKAHGSPHGLASDGFGTAESIHRLSETMRGALDDRARYLGDPDAVAVDPTALFAPDRIAKRASLYNPWRSRTPTELGVDEHGTSHLVVVDAEGDVVSLTTTVNTGFGAKIVAGDTGIILNDEMDDFGTKNGLPVPASKAPNLPRAGLRPTSSMTPTVVLEGGRLRLAIGGSGGLRIATSVTTVTLAHLVYGASLHGAILAPRIHTVGERLLVEPSLTPEVRSELEKRGEKVIVGEAMNAVQGVALVNGQLTAVADARKGGMALAR